MFQALLSITVNMGGSIGGVGNVLGHNGLALGGGDLVGHIGTGHLGHGVAVLNLDGDGLHLGVVNLEKKRKLKYNQKMLLLLSTYAVLGGDLTAGVLHGGLQRVGNSVGSDRGGQGSVVEPGSFRTRVCREAH